MASSDRMSELFGARQTGTSSQDIEIGETQPAGGSMISKVTQEFAAIKAQIVLIDTASKGIKELTKEYNSFDGHAVKKSGSQTREELIKADVARIRKETRPVCLAAKEALKEQKKKIARYQRCRVTNA